VRSSIWNSKPRTSDVVTTLTSRNGSLEIGPGLPTVLINDQLRVVDQTPQVLAELREGKFDKLLELARLGETAGMDMVDILVDHHELDEEELLPRIAAAVHDEIGCPISLDSRNPQALRGALKALQPNKALINSVTAEARCLESLLPIAREFGAAIVGMPIGDAYGFPKSVEGRTGEALTILQAAERHGIPREDVVIDAICLASSAEPGSMRVTLETLQALHDDLGVATILGIGNAGFGMPEQTRIDLAYLVAAVPWGLDAALVDPTTPGLISAVRAIDFLTERDVWGERYLAHYRARQAMAESGGSR
jgi:5-methyltetrahydrofolate--homocysteine methyltransferase